jgi:hypothetical protein
MTVAVNACAATLWVADVPMCATHSLIQQAHPYVISPCLLEATTKLGMFYMCSPPI